MRRETIACRRHDRPCYPRLDTDSRLPNRGATVLVVVLDTRLVASPVPFPPVPIPTGRGRVSPSSGATAVVPERGRGLEELDGDLELAVRFARDAADDPPGRMPAGGGMAEDDCGPRAQRLGRDEEDAVVADVDRSDGERPGARVEGEGKRAGDPRAPAALADRARYVQFVSRGQGRSLPRGPVPGRGGGAPGPRADAGLPHGASARSSSMRRASSLSASRVGA